LREILLSNEHVYVSKTDTEVIPHLIEEEMKRGQGLEAAVRATVKQLEGSYAFAVVSTREPIRLSCARKPQSSHHRVSDKGLFLSSDIPALL